MQIWYEQRWRDAAEALGLAASQAFQFGYGVFETLWVRDGQVLDLSLHIARMTSSIRWLEQDAAYTPAATAMLACEIQAAVAAAEASAVLKIIAYRQAPRDWRYILSKRPYPYTTAQYQRGYRLQLAVARRNSTSALVQHKTLNYLENVLARQAALAAGYDDAWFLNSAGRVAECATANLFILSGRQLLTPPVTAGLLPGIIRNKLLALKHTAALSIDEAQLSLADLRSAEAVFVTNSLLGVMPVAVIDTQHYPVQHETARHLAGLL